jgi:RimJ/RimL family protein N-acetyltransferase
LFFQPEGQAAMPVILETDRLVLRPWTTDDAEDALTIYGDPEVMRFLHRPAVQTLEEVRNHLEARPIAQYREHGFSFWAVVEKASGRVIGSCGLKYLDGGPLIEVGYHFARSAWGKGYATEGATACVRYGFDKMQLQRIMGVVDPLNFASQRVLEKSGLTFQGMGHYYNHDVRVYAVDRPATN